MFERQGSTLGVMDDLQIVIHSYDGCDRGCPGCIVDKEYKNKIRNTAILSVADLGLINSRVKEYYGWARENLNTKDYGYFGKSGYQIEHCSYTFRFGHHAELPLDVLMDLASSVETNFRVFSMAPATPEQIDKFVTVRRLVGGEIFLEIIYDPMVDTAASLREMILYMRQHGLLGYPEILITRRLLDVYPAERFVKEHVAPLGDLGIQMQFGRYMPSKTRNFAMSQAVPVDEEIAWLAEVARHVVNNQYDIHPIPVGEYAVTFLDEYKEAAALTPGVGIDESKLPDREPLNLRDIQEKTRDIFLSSIYIDEHLDVYIWAESMGQHVLDRNFGFKPLGNLRKNSLVEIMTAKGGGVDLMLRDMIRHMISHPRCGDCRYLSFCASHAIPFFRKFMEDDGEHCYGYLPVIREFQKSPAFLANMVDGFKRLGF